MNVIDAAGTKLTVTWAEHPATALTGPAGLDLPFATMVTVVRAPEIAVPVTGPAHRRRGPRRSGATLRARTTAVRG